MEVFVIAKPIISAAEAAAMVKPGQVVHLGGFLGCGTPDDIVHALVAINTGNLTVVCNDSGVLDPKTNRANGVVPLVVNHQCSKVITSHIGTSSESQKQMNAGELAVELVPQGTLAERVRCAGYGLGGVLTRTGVGTEVQDGKQVITVTGIDYLLELPLFGDVALIKAKRADKAGNLVYSKTARNFNPLMATACTLVIAEVEEIVEIGELDPGDVHTPFIFVHYLVQSESGGRT
jgi:acetate CoA/acetoacetate CoA-transferase alpha subunit